MTTPLLKDALIRVQLQYIEMPSLHLTLRQIRYVCDLTDDACRVAVNHLEQSGFLRQSSDGVFLRGGLGPWPLGDRQSALAASGS
jgi:hypothetical protein